MWGVSIADLKEINGIDDSPLKPGQKLQIPLAEQ